MKEINVYYLKESITQSIVRNIIMIASMSFCVYISKDSTFWTFISGGLLLIILSSKLLSVINDTKNTFKSKEALQEWVDGLPND